MVFVSVMARASLSMMEVALSVSLVLSSWVWTVSPVWGIAYLVSVLIHANRVLKTSSSIRSLGLVKIPLSKYKHKHRIAEKIELWKTAFVSVIAQASLSMVEVVLNVFLVLSSQVWTASPVWRIAYLVSIFNPVILVLKTSSSIQSLRLVKILLFKRKHKVAGKIKFWKMAFVFVIIQAYQ